MRDVIYECPLSEESLQQGKLIRQQREEFGQEKWKQLHRDHMRDQRLQEELLLQMEEHNLLLMRDILRKKMTKSYQEKCLQCTIL